ncbi:hypothetical protein B9W64_26735 [Streptomyces sp. CS159]|uniref:Uncharacterized protein n=1 Tax=Streptomyces coelicoflavus TaxID=285562 RepID=A0A6N9URH5_9ACTN|nr:hypothetical protein [Streptomyces coelicoflavus]OWA07975.1 hypothetical protein B9W64_26735 [Streptomyces sp. CS159]
MPQQPREGTAPAPRRRHLGLLSDCGARGPGRIKVVRAERSRGTARGRRDVPLPLSVGPPQTRTISCTSRGREALVCPSPPAKPVRICSR